METTRRFLLAGVAATALMAFDCNASIGVVRSANPLFRVYE